jgi:hypothetical protein
MLRLLAALGAAGLLSACADAPADPRQRIGYRSGVDSDDAALAYTSNGERGSCAITEVHFAGSVEGTLDARVHYEDDVFIEIQNRHPRPIWLTGWRIVVESSQNIDRMPDDWAFHVDASRSYVLPAPRSGLPIPSGGYAVISARDDLAFRDADYVVPGLVIPSGGFAMELFDIDDRVIDGIGDTHKLVFAGGFDGVTARSMERTQLLFGNRGERDASWHAYSLNDFDGLGADSLHVVLRAGVHPDFATLTFATPGAPNSPDYAGNVSSGELE